MGYYNYCDWVNNDLSFLFDAVKEWAREIDDYLTDSETYLMGGWGRVHAMLERWDEHNGSFPIRDGKPENVF